MDVETKPNFRVEKECNPPKVFLLCSECKKDIREIMPRERVRVNRAYYCKECDTGVVVVNMLHDKTTQEKK